MEEQKINEYLSYKLKKKLALDEVKQLDETYKDLKEEVETYFIKQNLKTYKTDQAKNLRVVNIVKYDTDKIINEMINAKIIPEELVLKLNEIKVYPSDFIEKYNDFDETTGQINVIEKKEKTLNFVINSLKRGYNEMYSNSKDYIDGLLDQYSLKTKQIRVTF
jgi:hypothetical protein